MEISKKLFNLVLDRVSINPKTNCWEYQGTLNPKGYGTVILGNVRQMTHRVVYQYLYRKVNSPYMLCHICNNPKCCNPSHLYEGTSRDNERDSILAGTSRFYNIDQRGSSNINCVLTEDIVLLARVMAKSGDYTHQSIAETLGVNRRTLSRAIIGESWTNLDLIEPPARVKGTKTSDQSSSLLGVSKKGNSYTARISRFSKRFNIGNFETEDLAGAYYDYCYQCLHETSVTPNRSDTSLIKLAENDTQLNKRLRSFYRSF